ncbi:hypothetical protein P3T73_06110 [Kiritimatiellota bacterium B12222]|nr:hypothetical protein P3T73_06110 [Kiritimatiellota bacterium B12222]
MMMRKMACLLLIWVGFSSFAFAESKKEYAPNVMIGDGKNGNSGTRWNMMLEERPIKEIRIRMQRVKGNDQTFVNLRFGPKGQTLDGGKRVYLKNNDEVVITWNVGGQSPGNQPLYLIGYAGEVKVMKVAVIYQ